MEIRASVVLIDNDSILLCRHKGVGDPYYVLPGGHVEPYEPTLAAAIREVREECNIEVDIEDIFAVGDFIKEGSRHKLDVIFRAKLVSGKEPTNKFDPERGKIIEVRWVPLDELGNLDCRPAEAFSRIRRDEGRIYLGRYA